METERIGDEQTESVTGTADPAASTSDLQESTSDLEASTSDLGRAQRIWAMHTGSVASTSDLGRAQRVWRRAYRIWRRAGRISSVHTGSVDAQTGWGTAPKGSEAG